MALKYRVRKLNGSGAYDTLHFETESSLTLRPDGSTTVEASLTTLESNSHAPASATLGTAADAPAFGETLSVVKSISTNANGHVTGVVTDTITFPALPSYLAYLSTITSDAQSQIDGKAPINSPAFTGTPKAPTTAAGDNSTTIATTAYVDGMVNAVLAAADAVCLKGTISGGDTLPTADAGWVYRVLSNGTISGFTAYTGDTITCFVDGTPANTPANWFITHNNDGSGVIGPLSSVDRHVAVFNGTTGKVLKDSGFTIGASVPAGAKFTDTVYTHPASHPPSIITQDSSNRFVTDTEKTTWNGKEPAITKNSAFNANFDTTAAHIKMNGTQSVGSLSTVARADHVHPTDTSRAAASHTHTISNITDLTATASEINVLDGITATTTELNYTDGVTSNIQTQLNSKASLSSPALTGTPTAPTATSGTNTTQLATTAFVQAALSTGDYGDMIKSVYDTNGDGIVDNAEKLNGHTVSEFAFVNTQNIYNGEQKFQNSSYCPTAMDNASGVGCAYKASRGSVNQEIVGQIIAPCTAASDSNYSISNAANVIKFQRIRSASAAAPTLADMGKVTSKGWEGGAVLSGTPTAPTATAGTNTKQIATTAFVQAAVSAAGKGIDIRVASSQPTDQSANDWWCESLA